MNSTSIKKNIPFLSISALVIVATITMGTTLKKSYKPTQEDKKVFFLAPSPSIPFRGVYACNPGLDDTFPLTNPGATTNYYWGSPDIDGVVERWAWSTIETGQGSDGKGTYAFTKLDTECQRAIRFGKGITLDIYGGMNAPSWFFALPNVSGTDYAQFYIKEADGTKTCANVPLPWSSKFISNFDTFMMRLSHNLSTTPYKGQYLISAIKVLKVGTCCTKYTSELRVPNDSCVNHDEASCCPFSDADTLLTKYSTKYTISKLHKSIDTMIDHAVRDFPGVIIAIPVISAGKGFPAPAGCTPSPTYVDCITPAIFPHVISTEKGDTTLVMGMYEALDTLSTDGSICKMLTGVPGDWGIIKNNNCLFGYQLNAQNYGGPVAGPVNCTHLLHALENGNSYQGPTIGASYFEVFEADFKAGTTGCEVNIGYFHSFLSAE